MDKDKVSFLFVAGIALSVGLSAGYILGNWQSTARKVEERPKLSPLGTELINKPRDPNGVSSELTSTSIFRAKSPAPSTSPASPCPPLGDEASGWVRTRPQIYDMPPGKRIVIQVTRSFAQSHVLACDVPVPAWNYLRRGHQVTIVVDGAAVTAFRRDSTGKSPLDRVGMLPSDLDDLSALLEVPLPAVPKNFGELYRILASSGIPILANEDALQALRIEPAELDPVITVVRGAEVQRLITNLDAFLPYSG